MITLFVYSLCAFAISYIVGASKISLPFRARLDRPGVRSWVLALLECFACSSWWLGLGAGYFFRSHGLENWFPFHWACLSLYTCASSLLLAKYAGLSD